MKSLLTLLLFFSLTHANERIIALSPSINEILYALNLYDDVVAISKYATYPKESKNKPKIGGYFSPNLEKILSLKPSLVIGAEHNRKILQQLEHFHIKTLELKFFTINDIKTSITKIAQATKSEDKSKELLTHIEEVITKEQNKHNKNIRDKRVLVVFGGKDDLTKSNYVAGHNGFYEEILTICGVKNAYNHNYLAQPVLDYESLVRLNADEVIILYSPQTDTISKKELLEKWNRLPINAVKNNKIHILEKDYLFIASQRITQSIEDICEVVND